MTHSTPPERYSAPMARVTVAVAVFNGGETLLAALQSCLDPGFEDLEFLVVDDGSTDDSAQIAEAFGARVVRQANTGLGGARKRLVEKARTEWIAFLDHDDFWQPGKLAAQVAALESSGAVLCHADGTYVYDDGREVPRDLKLSPDASAFRHILPNNWVIASTAVFHRETMLRAGNFIPDTVRCSDWYGWFVIAAQGRFVHVPERLVRYSVRSASLANAGFRFHQARRYLLKEQILPRFGELFGHESASDRAIYRKQIQREIGIAASAMAKALRQEGKRSEARSLTREAIRLAPTVPRVWTRAVRTLF